jgi:hypothetical protein
MASLVAAVSKVPLIEQPELYQRVEDLLRKTVRECFLDAAFHDYFKDNASVRKTFPLSPNPNARVCPNASCPLGLMDKTATTT